MRKNINKEAIVGIKSRRGEIALFVGAGISLGCGLPDWDTLLKKLSRKTYGERQPLVEEASREFSAISRTKLIKQKLGSRFNQAVSECLYADGFTISRAVEMIVRSDVKYIVNYNFDEILEEAFGVAGKRFRSVKPGENFDGSYPGTTILHPHGLLRLNSSLQEIQDEKIVFSEDDYSRIYSEPYSWANIIQLGILMNYSAVFVGCSLQDPNIRRLLDICIRAKFTHKHYAIFRSPRYAAAEWDKPLMGEVRNVLKADLSGLGVEPIWVKEYRDIPKTLKRIKNRTGSKEEAF